MHNFIITVLALIIIFPVNAYTVYKKVNEDGTIEYSDQPFPGSIEAQLPPVNTQDAQFSPPVSSSHVTEPVSIKSSINIISPSNGDSIRSNPGEFTIMVQKEVPDDESYLTQVLINNKPYLKPFKGTVFKVKDMDRGVIKIKVQLQSSLGNILATSKEIIVYMHKATINRAN